jgi:hypothetical protein
MCARPLPAQQTQDTMPSGVSPRWSAPVYAEAKPGVYLHDGAASVTYWVHEC